jgi:hypothetical protein
MKFLRALAALDKAHPLLRAHREDLFQQLLAPSLFVERNRAPLNNLPQIDELLDSDNTNAVEDRHAMMANLFAPLLARALDGDIGCTRTVKIASRSSTTLPFSTCAPAELRSGQLAGRFGRDHCGLLKCRCDIRDGYADGAVHSRVTRGNPYWIHGRTMVSDWKPTACTSLSSSPFTESRLRFGPSHCCG